MVVKGHDKKVKRSIKYKNKRHEKKVKKNYV